MAGRSIQEALNGVGLDFHDFTSGLQEINKRPTVARLFLIDQILLRGLRTGDKFPLDENELALLFGMSRNTVHLGWEALKQIGCIDIKQGRGVTILNSDFPFTRPDRQMYLWQLNLTTEVGVVRDAASHASAEAVHAMQDAFIAQAIQGSTLANMTPSRAFQNPLYDYLISEKGLHAAVRSACSDPWIAIVDEIGEVLTAPTRRGSFRQPTDALTRTQQHKAILDAIQVQDPDRAEAAVVAHNN